MSRCGEIRSDRLPRAKLCCFSVKSDRCTGTARRSDGPRRYKLASMKFDAFARCVFLRLPRSCRVAEKSDPIDRFSGPDLQKIVRKIDVFISFLITAHHQVPRSPIAIMAGGAPPPHTPPASQNTSIASIFAPESQKTQFFSKIRSLHRHSSTLRWPQTL